MTPALVDFCVCPDDYGTLTEREDGLCCAGCGREFEVRTGIPILLPEDGDDLHERFRRSYEQLARDDLEQPLEGQREARHEVLLDFVGSLRGKRVLDIGSSNGLYLRDTDAAFKVALDIALPFLEAIDPMDGIVAVCGDAERLPFAPGFFDVIIVSDIVEHLLAPEKLVERLGQIAGERTRIIVHVPWKEDLAPYKEMQWEFTHLHTFDAYSFSALFHQFRIRRRRPAYPKLDKPLIFHVERLLPSSVFDVLRYWYFHGGLAKLDYDARNRWNSELPRRERWLLWFFPPFFFQFELTPVAQSPAQKLHGALARLATVLRPARTSVTSRS